MSDLTPAARLEQQAARRRGATQMREAVQPEPQVPGQLDIDDMREPEQVFEVAGELLRERAAEAAADAGASPSQAQRMVDDAAAAGARIRAEREARAGKVSTPRHGYGWLDVEAFTEHLRRFRFEPVDEPGEVGTVNVRLSRSVVRAFDEQCERLRLSKRVVLESLLVEFVGPSRADGAR